MNAFAELFRSLARRVDDGGRVAVCTVVGAHGSTPQSAGATLLLHEDMSTEGTLGGGCVEAEVRKQAFALLARNESDVLKFQLDHDYGWDDGLIGGGTMRVAVMPVGEAAEVAAFLGAAESLEGRRPAGVSLRVGGYSSSLEQIVVLASGAFVALLTPEVMTILRLPGWSGWLFLPFVLVVLFPDLLGQIIWKAGIRRFDLRMEQPPTPKFMVLYFSGHVARVMLGGMGLILMLKLFHTDPSGLTWFNLPGIASAAFVVGYLSLLTPGGVGVKEGILVLLLSQYIPLPVALSIAVSGRLWAFLADISGIAVASLYFSLTQYEFRNAGNVR